jgi:hypothetical protein
MRRHVRTLAALGSALAFVAGAVAADDTLAPGQPACRSSYVLPIAPWARPSNTPDYVGYYVGGGCAWRGEPRFPDEGTYGWDYGGCYFARRVWLLWCHGRRYQGGTGAYESDGVQSPLSVPPK